jgi:CRISPR-associated protein Csm2
MAQYNNQGGSGRGSSGRSSYRQQGSSQQKLALPAFSLSDITVDLFSETAKRCAEVISTNGKMDKDKNKSTQLRRFYDEVCMWAEKVGHDATRFDENLPFIKMIGAKVAYANGRKLVDDTFLDYMEQGLKQVKDLKTFNTFKTFMEAFMGYYKMYNA